MTYKEGDFVKVITEGETTEGILLPRPEMLKGEFIVIKLENGYNIGIDKKKIKKIELIKKYETPSFKKINIVHKKDLKNITVISAGGTISSKVDYKTGGTIADYTAEDFVQMMPSLKDLANLKALKSLNIMSEDMNISHWIKIAEDIEKELNNGADGVVLSQGTDTLQYSAAALSFFFHDVKKPIIITAAQRSIDRGSSDAYMNLVCSINVAANFDGAGVFVCMHADSNDVFCNLTRGTKVRKMHTSRRDAFRSINSMPIAEIYHDKEIKIIDKNYNKRDDNSKTKSDTVFEEKIGFLQVTPLIDPKIIDFYVDNDYKGIVLNGTGLGHVPLNGKNSLSESLKKANKKGVIVIMTSQCINGRVNPYVYSNARELLFNYNIIYAEDMTPETAFIKLGWVLGHTNDPKKIREMMLTNYSYEINKSIDEKSFLC